MISSTHSVADVFQHLDRRQKALDMRFATLQGQAQELQRKRTSLVSEIGILKGLEELAPEAQKALEFLLEEANQEAVGDFEDLLTTFLNDVSPTAGDIKLVLGTDRQQPALDILLDNGGDLENILTSNGGGVTNVVVTGLGYSTLARSKNRQVMLLDEPDCWLKAPYIPNFTKVIAETANPRTEADGSRSLGCQTLMISHNDLANMDDGAHIQELRINHDLTSFAASHGLPVIEVGDKSPIAYVVHVGGSKPHIRVQYREVHEGSEEKNALTRGYPFVQPISGARAWASKEETGIRWIEVLNVQSHIKTRLDLSPGLNVMGGDINTGKSTLYFVALRALGYGETDDLMIRHGADSMTIRIGLENDVVLEVVRYRKGSAKVMFRRYQAGKMTNEGGPGKKGNVPSFIESDLNISKIDDLDVQLRNQKQPVFLLNESPARRAKLLSVGKEAGLLALMLEKHRKRLKRDKARREDLEQELSVVNRTLLALSPLAHLKSVSELVTSYLDEAKLQGQNLQLLQGLVAKMDSLDQRVRLSNASNHDLAALPVISKLHDTVHLTNIAKRIDRNWAAAQLRDLTQPPAITRLLPTDGLARSIAKLSRVAELAQLPDIALPPSVPKLAAVESLKRVVTRIARSSSLTQLIPHLGNPPAVPVLAETRPIRNVGVRISDTQKRIDSLTLEQQQATTDAQNADAELALVKKELGYCPLCNQGFGEHTHA